jgi:hypothetical protein
MLINTSLSPETAAQDLRNSRATGSSPAPVSAASKTPGPDSAEERLQGLGLLDEDGIPAITSAAGADQVTEFFRANLLSQYTTALAAQANLNPESVCNLLRI